MTHVIRQTDLPESSAVLLQPYGNETLPPYQDALVRLIGMISKAYLDAHAPDAPASGVFIEHVDPEGRVLISPERRAQIEAEMESGGLALNRVHMVRVRHGARCSGQVRGTGVLKCTCRASEWAVETDAPVGGLDAPR